MLPYCPQIPHTDTCGRANLASTRTDCGFSICFCTPNIFTFAGKSVSLPRFIKHIIYIYLRHGNKYITVSYRLYAMNGGEKELIEEAPAAHPFQFISGIGYTLDRFEKEITALEKEMISISPFLVPKLTENVMRTMCVRFLKRCSVTTKETLIAKTSSPATSSC